MTDPTPTTEQTAPPKAGWMPTSSTLLGASIGEPVAQIIVAAWNSFVPAHAFDLQTAGAVHMLCIGLAGYFFLDGGRK